MRPRTIPGVAYIGMDEEQFAWARYGAKRLEDGFKGGQCHLTLEPKVRPEDG